MNDIRRVELKSVCKRKVLHIEGFLVKRIISSFFPLKAVLIESAHIRLRREKR